MDELTAGEKKEWSKKLKAHRNQRTAMQSRLAKKEEELRLTTLIKDKNDMFERLTNTLVETIQNEQNIVRDLNIKLSN